MEGLPERLAVEGRAGVGWPFQGAELVNPTARGQTVGNKAVALLVRIKVQVSERSLAAGLAVVIENLVLQDADEPALFRAAPGELFAAPERRQKGFLDHVLGFRRVTQAH